MKIEISPDTLAAACACLDLMAERTMQRESRERMHAAHAELILARDAALRAMPVEELIAMVTDAPDKPIAFEGKSPE